MCKTPERIRLGKKVLPCLPEDTAEVSRRMQELSAFFAQIHEWVKSTGGCPCAARRCRREMHNDLSRAIDRLFDVRMPPATQ